MSKKGRITKFKSEYTEQAYQLCLLGATDKTLAEYFEVNTDTIYQWKIKYKHFSEALRRGKLQADSKVAAALFKRAIGFKYNEVTFERIDGKQVLEVTPDSTITSDAYKKKIVTKLVIPDTGAAISWLTNRQKDLWRNKQDVATDGESLNNGFSDMMNKLKGKPKPNE